jgi:hypothetical protein
MMATLGIGAVLYEPVDHPLGRLLGEVRPVDWNDPQARARRIRVLEDVACATAELVTEVMVQRATGRDLLIDDDCVVSASRALTRLHRGLCKYQRDTQLYDGLAVAESAIIRDYSPGIAILTLKALEQVREQIMQMMRETWSSGGSAVDLDDRSARG